MTLPIGTFDFLMDFLAPAEGGYSNHKADRGGPTKYGVTQRFLDEYCDLKHLPHMPVKAITRDIARDAYLNLIWLGKWVKAREVCQLAPVTGFVYADSCILHGRDISARFLQREVGSYVDGKVGPQTLTDLQAEANHRDDQAIAEGLLKRRRELVEEDVRDDPTQMQFYHGWINRLNNVARRADVRWRWTYLAGDSDDVA